MKFGMWEVDFTVWDAASDLAPDRDYLTSIEEGQEGRTTLQAIGLPRGSVILHGPGLTVNSFRPSAIAADPSWPLSHSVMSFASTISSQRRIPIRDAVSRLQVLADAADPASIMVGDREVDADFVEISQIGWVVASRDRKYPLACYGYQTEVPEFRLAESANWRS